MKNIQIAEHLFEMYPQIPKYANDPQQNDIIKTYDRIMNRFQGYYGKQPAYFVKASASPILFGDNHDCIDLDYAAFCSNQNVVIAISSSSAQQIRINNYQTAVYGEKVLSTNPNQWKFDEQEDKYLNIIIKSLSALVTQSLLKELLGMDILIYSDFIEEEFMYWRQALVHSFYTAIYTISVKGKQLECAKLQKAIKRIKNVATQISPCPQLLNNSYGCFTIHQSPFSDKKQSKNIELSKNYSIVLAHSMTPLPKKLVQGKRFNLRKCQILIGIQFLKSDLGLGKNIKSIGQLLVQIGCTVEQLLASIQETVPKGKVTVQQIQATTEKSMIQILKEVPYANNVIDQNTEFYPYDRLVYFLKEIQLLQNLTQDNLIESLKESFKNQQKHLGIRSEQIDELLKIGEPYSQAHKIVGNGWGGNIVFICKSNLADKLVEDLISNFYLNSANKILLSDDVQQYVKVVGVPCTGLMVLNPESQIWY